jgi:hypothetical protein
MAELNLYDLLAGGEPSAREQAALMAQRIRGRSGLGELALLTGDPVLGRFGQALTQRGAGDQELLANALTGRAQREFQARGEMDPAGDALRQVGLRLRVNLPADMPTRKAKEALDYAEKAYAAEQRGNELALNREAMRSAKDDARRETQQRQLSEEVGKMGAPNFYQKYSEARPIIDTNKDLPGVGPLAGHLPDMLVSQQGKELRQAVGQMLAEYRKGITGAGMSDAERAEYGHITGLLEKGDEAAYRSGVERLKRAMDARMQAAAGGYPQEVVESYGARVPGVGAALRGQAGAAPGPAQAGSGRPPGTKVFYSAKTNKTKLVYPDGREEIRDGKP